jgi:peptidoglycan/xylan/chitin deacetylase (PgdA/CDA1 family)
MDDPPPESSATKVRLPALVISLDFELHWGVRDIHSTSSAYMASLLGAREAIPRILDVFAEYEVSATWATVGFLFAEGREELESFHPVIRPEYENRRLDPYAEAVGIDEAHDPVHFAPSLIRMIGSVSGQEIATHTYSHFYCLEAGGGEEAFRHDIASAQAIARGKGVEVRSIVLPRNQWNSGYASVLAEAGIECFRGNQPGWMYNASSARAETRLQRLSRLVDAHVPLTSWSGVHRSEITDRRDLHDVAATCFLRPVSERSSTMNGLRLNRITTALTRAAQESRLFHLWWHPHNFGIRTTENLRFLRSILDHYRRLAGEHGMRSLSMIEASDTLAPRMQVELALDS